MEDKGERLFRRCPQRCRTLDRKPVIELIELVGLGKNLGLQGFLDQHY
jgi:hypothetical protein